MVEAPLYGCMVEAPLPDFGAAAWRRPQRKPPLGGLKLQGQYHAQLADHHFVCRVPGDVLVF